MNNMGLVVAEAVADHIDKLEKRDRFNLKLQADQRRTIKDLRRQIGEHTAYVNSGKQQIDMIKLAQVVGKFDRETHLLQIVKLVPAIKQDLCGNLQPLLAWAYPGLDCDCTPGNAEQFASAAINLSRQIIGEERP